MEVLSTFISNAWVIAVKCINIWDYILRNNFPTYTYISHNALFGTNCIKRKPGVPCLSVRMFMWVCLACTIYQQSNGLTSIFVLKVCIKNCLEQRSTNFPKIYASEGLHEAISIPRNHKHWAPSHKI